jgi:hypothetical protein
MEHLTKLEKKLLKWGESLPHLPKAAREWLGANIWWIALIGAILSGISVIVNLNSLFDTIAVLGTIGATYFATTSITSWMIVTSLVSIFFTALSTVVLAFSIKPLQNKEKKGWVLLFVTWLLSALSTVVMAVLSLSVFSFIVGLMFGAIWLAISGYFLFEIHGQFAHAEKSKGVKAKKAA